MIGFAHFFTFFRIAQHTMSATSAAQPELTPIPPALRRRLLRQLLLILTCGLLLSSSYLWFSATRDARAQTLQDGGQLMRQSAILLQPLLLADDRVSLNYLVNELGAKPEIRGIALYNQNNELVARSGEGEGPLERELMLERERQPLGRMLFWLDPAPARQQRLSQLYLVAALWLASTLAAVLTLAVALRARAPAVTAQDDAMGDEDLGDAVVTDAALADPAAEATEDDVEPDSEAPETAGDTHPAARNDDADEYADEQAWDDLDQKDSQPHDNQHPGHRAEPGFDGLLELLRPVKERLMPRFTPSAPQADESERHQEPRFLEESLEFDDLDELGPAEPARQNPLRERAETQLGLYSFEHEMALVLAPQDASYLLLIDAASGHAEYVEGEERDALLHQYGQYARQIAAIYSGEMEPQDNGDILIWFREPTGEDAHGANALCAAKLFSLLYRAFNQGRIRNFLPVLNLHISLVRGNSHKPQLMLEEAQFLTRSTQSNELISHTALSEAPDLKSSLLEGADIRREDEDKVLIHSLSDAYEELLEKQASHLMRKPG
jgi:uncharacterized membrane protein affecting hemolysin expression